MCTKPVSIDELKLVKALQQSDIFAFNELFHKYSQKIFNFAMKHMEQKEDAKDLVQDVFITIWKKREDIDEKQSFNGYLFAITLNAIRKYFRKKVKDRKLVENWLNNTKSFSDETNLMTEYRSLKERSDVIIEQLPPKRKKVFLLSREKGLKVEEIARKMDISKKTAENHLSLALRDIRNKLLKETLMMVLFFTLFY